MKGFEREIFMRYLVLFFSVCLLTSCGNPMEQFYKELKNYGYIPYKTPMKSSGTGTLIGGSPEALQIIANPYTCFPDLEGELDNYRFRDDSTLPKTSQHFYVDSDVQVEVFEVLEAGSPSIKAGVQLRNVSTMELEFNGIHIEYIDSVKVIDYYRERMSDVCRQYIENVGFVIQAIVADEMRFSLYTSDGGNVDIDVENIEQYIDVSVDTEWEIIRNTTLVIKTPKFIGYQLAKMKEVDRGLLMSRTAKVELGKWVYEDLPVFPHPDL